jgi:hypothetical protein
VLEWEPFEISQAEIFDHVLASLPDFGLRVLQNSGYALEPAVPVN